MEGIIIIAEIISAAFVLVGAVDVCWQLYRIVSIDAESRGLRHPKLWGLLAANGNDSSGLILYFIRRRNHPVINLSENDKKNLESGKKRTGVGLIFLAVGAVSFIVLQILL